jgi:signal peptidase I
VIGIATVFYAFPLKSYTVSSGSMLPTMVTGDYFLVLRRYDTPERGDIVTFSYPADPKTAFVARLVGMPGDRLQMIKGLLHINGQPVKRAQVENFVGEGGKPVKQWSETLPNSVTHRTIDLVDNGFYDNTPVYVVPDGHYFMMGDNRDNATDSRVKSRTIPRENLIGRVFFCLRSTCR